MGCFSGRLTSAASDQKLFCKLCSPFCCSFDEFVGEKVISPSYSSAILTPPPQVPFPLISWLNGSDLHPCGVESLGILSVPGNGIFWALPAVISSIDYCVTPAHCSLSCALGHIFFFLYSSDASLAKGDENSIFLKDSWGNAGNNSRSFCKQLLEREYWVNIMS